MNLKKLLREVEEICKKRYFEEDLNPNKIEYIQIRVTKEEKELIKKLANCQCLSVSSFFRWLALSKYKDDFIKG